MRLLRKYRVPQRNCWVYYGNIGWINENVSDTDSIKENETIMKIQGEPEKILMILIKYIL